MKSSQNKNQTPDYLSNAWKASRELQGLSLPKKILNIEKQMKSTLCPLGSPYTFAVQNAAEAIQPIHSDKGHDMT